MKSSSLPRISVVTACFNMEKYIEQTIRSVLTQNYSNLEYIVIDGGSTDGTLDIIEKYRDRIQVVISEPDDGMYDAIQKGMNYATGDVLAWLNADDIYLPWTFSIVGEIFGKFWGIDWIIGRPSNINAKGQFVNCADSLSSFPRKIISNGWAQGSLGAHVQQESTFWRRSLWDAVDGLDTRFKYAGDYELWTRFAQKSDLVEVDVPLACFRSHGESQLSRNVKYSEEVEIVQQGKPSVPWLWKVCSKKVFFANICRRLIWSTGRVATYDKRLLQWVLVKAHLPIGRNTLQKLYITWKSNRDL